MIFNETVSNYKKLLNKAIKCELYEINDCNSNKNIRCYRNVIACLDMLNPETVIVVESARGKAKRPFDIPNVGSLMECVLKMVCEKEQASEYSKEFSDDKADIKIGWCEYEIKSCMGSVSLNTKITGDKPILFVNECGVFSIKKAEIEQYTYKGKLPYNKAVGKMWVGLSKKLGYEM